MADQLPNKKRRVSGPRTRTGCITCKMRHVKCSGERPVCFRCIGIGRKCEGYPPSKESSRARRFVDFASTSTAQITSVSSYAIPFRMPGSQQERQLVHYFCIEAVPSHSGHLNSDYEFWGQSVLQYMQEDAVVRQAVVAYSSSHADYVLGNQTAIRNDTEREDPDTLQLYGKAVRRLQKYIATDPRPSLRTVLMCCILFYCFESTRTDYDAALEHLQTGLRILQEAKYAESQSQDGTAPLAQDIEMLARVFARLDVQASIFNGTRMPALCMTSADERAGITPLISKTGALSPLVSDVSSWGPLVCKTSASSPLVPMGSTWSVGQAIHMLNRLSNWLFSFLVLNSSHKSLPKVELPARLVAEKSELLWQYRNYSVALEELLQQKESLAPGHSYDVLSILKLHHRTTQMLLEASFPEDLHVFGASPNPAAEEALDLAQVLVNRSSQSIRTASKHSFPLQIGIIGPVAVLALKCWDAAVCESALALLVSSDRRESLIDSDMIARITRRITRLKERQHLSRYDMEGASQQVELRDGDYTAPLGAWGAKPIDREPGDFHNMAKLLNVRYVASGTIFLLPKV